MKTKIALALALTLALASSQALAQGFWKFDEGAFQPACPGNPIYNANGHAVDWSGAGNHACLENPNRNVKYTSDAYAGPFGLHLNDPADAAVKFLPGYLFAPHSTTLEPPTGMIEAAVKIREFPSVRTGVLAKSTFWFVRTEPVMPVFLFNGEPHLIGRTAYLLEIRPDGFLRAIVANDDPNAPGPWTELSSGAVLAIGVWNQLAMKWDGCRLPVTLNGSSVSVPYDPVPILGLSYQGTGNDPTSGPLTLPAQIGSDSLVGQIDEVRLSRVAPCTGFTIASTNQLISNVRSLNLEAGITSGLVAILQEVVTRLGPDPVPFAPDPSTVRLLQAFINAVEAHRGRLIAPADADALIAVATQLIAGLTI